MPHLPRQYPTLKPSTSEEYAGSLDDSNHCVSDMADYSPPSEAQAHEHAHEQSPDLHEDAETGEDASPDAGAQGISSQPEDELDSQVNQHMAVSEPEVLSIGWDPNHMSLAQWLFEAGCNADVCNATRRQQVDPKFTIILGKLRQACQGKQLPFAHCVKWAFPSLVMSGRHIQGLPHKTTQLLAELRQQINSAAHTPLQPWQQPL